MPTPLRILILLPALIVPSASAFADATAKWQNPSRRAFAIENRKVENASGTLTFRDGSTTIAAWTKDTPEGKTIPWEAKREFTVTYSGGFRKENAHFRIRVLDDNKNWIDFIADNPKMGSPTVTLDRLGPKVNAGEGEGTGFRTEGLKGGLKTNNSGFWGAGGL
jgi:hypothetical protein